MVSKSKAKREEIPATAGAADGLIATVSQIPPSGPSSTDAERAAHYKQALADALEPVSAIMSLAYDAHGMELNFSMKRDEKGKMALPTISCTKSY